MTFAARTIDGDDDVQRLDTTTYADVVVPGTATVTFKIDNDGGVYVARAHAGGGLYVKQYDWVLPNTSASNYECRWLTTGADPTTVPAASGTWLACTADRVWSNTATNNDYQSLMTVELRYVGAGVAVKTATVGLDALGAP